MKFNFKKIAAIGASALMVGMSMGVAAAANFPAPFSGTAASSVAVVSGTGAGVDDTVATNSMANYLAGKVSGGGTITGESHKFERASTKLWLGRGLLDISGSALDDDELPNLLADGTYTDNDNDEFDYSQKLQVANLSLELFDDNDYKRDTPTVGIKIDSNVNVLNYTLEFVEDPYWDDLGSTDLTIMGKEYFILSTSGNTTLNLLDSGETTVLSEGETATVGGKQVSITYISSLAVKLSIDGQVTNSLGAGDTQKLSGGSYVGVKEILYVEKESGVSKVEFSIGTGKLVIANDTEVEMNEEDVDGLTAEITNSNDDKQLASIKLIWNADEEAFIAPDSEVTMPGFETVKFSMGGMVFPVEEEIGVENDGNDNIVLKNFPLKDTTYSINLLESNSTNYTLIGKDSDNRFATAFAGEDLTFVKGIDDYFVVSYMSGDDAESYLIRASSFDDGTNGTDPADDTVTFQYMVSGSWKDLKKNADAEDVVSVGLADFTVESVDDSTDTVIVSADGNNNFHMLYSAEGLEVWLPWINTTDYTSGANDTVCGDIYSVNAGLGQLGYNATLTLDNSTELTCTSFPATYTLMFFEETKDGNIGRVGTGNGFNLTIGLNDQVPKEVEVGAVVGATGGYEIGEGDVYRSFVYGALATEIKHDQSGDQDTVTIVYHGGESYGEVYLSEVGASLGGAEAGSMVFTDAETASWQGRNVVLVGGSCINSATAQALGVAYPTCATAFTTATGVGSGQYLIKSIAGSSGGVVNSGKIALVVAGYSKADTQAAVNRLIQPGSEVDTTAGKAYLGIVGATGTSTLAPM